MKQYSTIAIRADELAETERKLQSDGYRPTDKTDDEDLLPCEYLTAPYAGTAGSDEAAELIITCRLPE